MCVYVHVSRCVCLYVDYFYDQALYEVEIALVYATPAIAMKLIHIWAHNEDDWLVQFNNCFYFSIWNIHSTIYKIVYEA